MFFSGTLGTILGNREGSVQYSDLREVSSFSTDTMLLLFSSQLSENFHHLKQRKNETHEENKVFFVVVVKILI